MLAFELRRRTRVRLTDLGPMRAARREALLALGIQDRRFGWPLEMVLRASAAGWRLEEVPVTYLAREGRSKVTGTIRGTVRTVRDMSFRPAVNRAASWRAYVTWPPPSWSSPRSPSPAASRRG